MNRENGGNGDGNGKPVERHGLLLTRHWRDRPAGLEVVLWGKSGDDPVRLCFSERQAVCFAPQGGVGDDILPPGAARRPLELRTMDDEPVDGLYFRRQADLQDFRGEARGRGLRLYESDVNPCERFLMERFISGAFTLRGVPRRRRGYTEYHDPQLRRSPLPPSEVACLRSLSVDVETDPDGILYSVAASGEHGEQVFVINTGKERKGDPVDAAAVTFVADEAALLGAFFQYFEDYDPDVLIGWSVVQFDLEVLARACKRHGSALRLGRGGERCVVLQPERAGQRRIASLPGRVVLDGIETLRAAFWYFESFSLEAVARELLGRGKAIHLSKNKVAEIGRLYREHQYALAHYNVEDCRLVREIFEHTGLLGFAVERAALTGLALGRQGGSVAAFDNLYLPRLHRKGRVAPDLGDHDGDETSPGGYVFDSAPGIYRNVLLLDFKSLYPSIIRTFCIDPLGLHQPGEDPVPGFLGARFARRGHILPQLIEHLWQQRDRARAANNQALSQAIKIIMNSFYGVLGSSGCRFFSAQLASSITRRGHEIMRASRDFIEERGHRVIYGDTDSLFVLFGGALSEAEAERGGRALVVLLNDYWRRTLERRHRLHSYLEAEYEMLFHRFLMPTVRGAATGSKKRYAGAVHAPGGMKLVIRGLESVRTDWTALARGFQKELLRRLFADEPLEDYIRGLCRDLYTGALDDQLVYSKRMRRPLELYKRNVPPHVQAARKMRSPGRLIRYVVTPGGPQPVDGRALQPDYHHYREKQLKPVADGILHFLGTGFDNIIVNQPDLFQSPPPASGDDA